MASDTRNPAKRDGSLREKVRIQPGFHLADWMRLMQTSNVKYSDNDIPPKLRRISMAELAKHNTPDDCWMSYEGRVYNVTHYFPYHPGGIPKLMLCAGQDCKALFDRYHRWVNMENMIGKCWVGILDPSLDLEEVKGGGGSESSDNTNSDIKNNNNTEALVSSLSEAYKSNMEAGRIDIIDLIKSLEPEVDKMSFLVKMQLLQILNENTDKKVQGNDSLIEKVKASLRESNKSSTGSVGSGVGKLTQETDTIFNSLATLSVESPSSTGIGVLDEKVLQAKAIAALTELEGQD
jgi:cytochrome b involved in lipid metabolism